VCVWTATAGILANKYLEKRLNEYGYYQSDYTNGLWSHESRPIQFALCVDDFGVKYINEADVEHLLKAALTATNPKTDNSRCSKSQLTYGRLEILWPNHGLGLQKPRGSCIHPRVCRNCPQKIQTSDAREATTPTIPTQSKTIRPKATVCRGQRRIATPWKRRQKIHSGGNWHLLVLCQGS
jgi:hypothetical protein